jgi:hypothetical protein
MMLDLEIAERIAHEELPYTGRGTVFMEEVSGAITLVRTPLSARQMTSKRNCRKRNQWQPSISVREIYNGKKKERPKTLFLELLS